MSEEGSSGFGGILKRIEGLGGGSASVNADSGGMDKDEIMDSMDAKVKQVADMFQFMLKYKQQFQASGVEFSGLRQYVVTDDASRIDWKNSAGKQDLYVKQYEEEKNMDTFVLLDASRTMKFGTGDKLKSEFASLITSTIAYASVNASLNVGLGIYGADSTILSPDGGNPQYRKVLQEITDEEKYGGRFNLEESLNDVIAKIKDDTVIFIISDFLDIEGDWKSTVRVATEKFRHVSCVMVRDLRDYRLPEDGNFRLKSPDGEEEMVVNTDRIREEFEKEAQRQEEQVKETAENAGASFMKIDTRDDFAGKFATKFDEEGEKW